MSAMWWHQDWTMLKVFELESPEAPSLETLRVAPPPACITLPLLALSSGSCKILLLHIVLHKRKADPVGSFLSTADTYNKDSLLSKTLQLRVQHAKECSQVSMCAYANHKPAVEKYEIFSWDTTVLLFVYIKVLLRLYWDYFTLIPCSNKNTLKATLL